MSNETYDAPDEAAPRHIVPAQSDVAKALNRVADALFRQAKAAERSVALQEQMVQASKKMADNQIDFDALVNELEKRRG